MKLTMKILLTAILDNFQNSNDPELEPDEIDLARVSFSDQKVTVEMYTEHRMFRNSWSLVSETPITINNEKIPDFVEPLKRLVCLNFGKEFWENVKSSDPLLKGDEIELVYERREPNRFLKTINKTSMEDEE